MQEPIDVARIREMLTRRPRRKKLALDWPTAIYPPDGPGKDPRLVLPFFETFENAFAAMCTVDSTRFRGSAGGRCYTSLRVPPEGEEVEQVQRWVDLVGRFVVLRDCLALSCALDYDREGGNPGAAKTTVGELRWIAKPYHREATAETLVAADALVGRCAEFMHEMSCYRYADAVVAMPPSDPEKRFDLPTYLAAGLAMALDVPDLSASVRTVRARPPVKDTPVGDKLDKLLGSVEVGPGVTGRSILLVDDLYQSGVSMNYVAMELLAAGATGVFGLACEKTCRNDDNVPRE